MYRNRTRYSKSIPKRLLKEGKIHLIPIYYVMHLSFLAREGIENSGSYKFADHIYVSKPKGHVGIGKLLDKILLSLPSSKSFRNRFFHSKNTIHDCLINDKDKKRVLSVPSGIPRELIETAEKIKINSPERYQSLEFYCIDADSVVLGETRRLLEEKGLKNFTLIKGDIYDKKLYPSNMDIISSTGFGEFVDDKDLLDFYNLCADILNKDGIFVTSATLRHRLSDYLMKHIAELLVYYRDETLLDDIFRSTPFSQVSLERDSLGYQVLVKAKKST